MGANVPINTNYLSPPRNPIVATENRFAFPQQTALLLRERIYSWTGDDFDICDFYGRPYFKCGGRLYSFRQTKVILDVYNIPIYNIKHEIFTFRGRFKIYQGNTSARIIASVDPIDAFGSIYAISFYNLATGRIDY